MDFMEILKNMKIQRTNVYKLCNLFIEVCKIDITKLNGNFQSIIKDKGAQLIVFM